MPIGRFTQYRTDIFEFLVRRHLSLPPEIGHSDRLGRALKVIATRWPDAAADEIDAEKPIFIFSAGWRAGSTLLQRLVMSGTHTIVWGEPLGDTATAVRLAHGLEILSDDWPPGSFFPGNVPANDLAGEWIANLTPTIASLRQAHRAFFLAWLRDTAATDYGANRWGLKEVRLTMEHARYFQWLFPHAKFLFIVRNPLDAFRSWKGNRWRSPWPGYYRNSAITFARHWARLAGGFLDGHADVGGMFIRYEDLIEGRIDLETLAAHLELPQIDPTPLSRRIDTPTDKRPRKKRSVNAIDRLFITSLCARPMQRLDYR